ncbi:hypothetical protein PSEUDO8BK_10621 [Pseudomonas sp. 8BK]|nr:hypothetical protein PSEUDO8BK_10621 [Pseudomonas sp. 8BK]
MLFGAILVLSWLILLIRYPSKALPISLGALIGLGLVASWPTSSYASTTRRTAARQIVRWS